MTQPACPTCGASVAPDAAACPACNTVLIADLTATPAARKITEPFSQPATGQAVRPEPTGDVGPRGTVVLSRKRKTTEKDIVDPRQPHSGASQRPRGPEADTVVELRSAGDLDAMRRSELPTRVDQPATGSQARPKRLGGAPGAGATPTPTTPGLPTPARSGVAATPPPTPTTSTPSTSTPLGPREPEPVPPAVQAAIARPPADPTTADLQVRAPVPTVERGRNPSQLVQRYADGVDAHFGGDVITAATRVVELPYRSTDVALRLDRYDLLNELGRGGMGVVYKAYSLHLDRFCAVKLMTAGMHAGEVAAVRFQNEARIASCLKHDHIVSIFDSGVDADGRLYFVMEYVEGEDLARFSDRPGNLEAAVRAIAKTARALAYAHERGVIHRDIKSDNILIDKSGDPHITDFGIARREMDAGLTQDGFAMGTPSFMSPEQANGEVAAIGPATDIYSLGATLYDVLAGRPPFEGDGPYAVMSDVVNKEPEPPSQVARKNGRAEVPPDLETICLKALEKEAAARYPTMEAFAEDLEAFLEDRPITARPVGQVERLRKLIRRNRAAFVGATLVGLTLMVLTLSYGAVLIFNVERTSDALTELDTEAGVDQAGTLEKAIRTNMLQGRADVVRELVAGLRADPAIASIDVVRTDRTFAYTDRSTRVQVEKRLSDEDLVARVTRERPGMAEKIADLKRVGFTSIDAAEKGSGGLYDMDLAAWKGIVDAGKTHAVREEVDGRPVLTVFKPIENSAECQVCHGAPDEAGYDANRVRGVLVVRRSQEGLAAQISRNRVDTIAIGGGTALLLIVIAAVFARLTGIGVPKRSFGSGAPRS